MLLNVIVLPQTAAVPSFAAPIYAANDQVNPYDNASCESFMKTLKREEIYANQFQSVTRESF